MDGCQIKTSNCSRQLHKSERKLFRWWDIRWITEGTWRSEKKIWIGRTEMRDESSSLSWSDCMYLHRCRIGHNTFFCFKGIDTVFNSIGRWSSTVYGECHFTNTSDGLWEIDIDRVQCVIKCRCTSPWFSPSFSSSFHYFYFFFS